MKLTLSKEAVQLGSNTKDNHFIRDHPSTYIAQPVQLRLRVREILDVFIWYDVAQKFYYIGYPGDIHVTFLSPHATDIPIYLNANLKNFMKLRVDADDIELSIYTPLSVGDEQSSSSILIQDLKNMADKLEKTIRESKERNCLDSTLLRQMLQIMAIVKK